MMDETIDSSGCLTPRVTILLTSYNHEPYLRESIQSILDQTYSSFELIVLDDCSTDDSWPIILSFDDPRIVPIRNERNVGRFSTVDFCKAIDTDYVAIAHSDDRWKPEKLRKQIEYLDANPACGACFTKVSLIDDKGEAFRDEDHPYARAFECENGTRFDWLHTFFFGGNCLCHPSVVLRRRTVLEANLTTDGFNNYADMIKWVRLCRYADLYVLDERLTEFRIHGDESNDSGNTALSRNGVRFDSFLILREFRAIEDIDEFLAVFPEARRYVVDGVCVKDFAFAQMCLLDGRPELRTYGLEVLYELLSSVETRESIAALYGYDGKAFCRDKRAMEVFAERISKTEVGEDPCIRGKPRPRIVRGAATLGSRISPLNGKSFLVRITQSIRLILFCQETRRTTERYDVE